MQVKFYKCEHCGNVVAKVVDQGVPVACCGQPMTELASGAVDAAVEKHVPVVAIDGASVHVEVGSVEHPMTPEHSIQFICLVTEGGYAVAPLSPDDKPVADFALREGDEPVAVYEYCNLHGLWVAEL